MWDVFSHKPIENQPFWVPLDLPVYTSFQALAEPVAHDICVSEFVVFCFCEEQFGS
jgi:hypothetical protein